jgi:hypothetical protein
MAHFCAPSLSKYSCPRWTRTDGKPLSGLAWTCLDIYSYVVYSYVVDSAFDDDGSHEVRGSNPLRSIYLQVKPSARATLGQQPVLMLYAFGIQLSPRGAA